MVSANPNRNTKDTHLRLPAPVRGSYCSHTYPVLTYSCEYAVSLSVHLGHAHTDIPCVRSR